MPLVSSLNTKEFIEVTRRIKTNELEFIDTQLRCVNNQELTKLQQICQQPELILTTENTFFSDKKFSFIILKALQLGILSVCEFASLQTWHEVYNEQKLLNPETSPQLYKLLNADNSYNEKAWEIIISTIERCNPSLIKDVIQINNSQVVSALKQQSFSNSAIDNCFILFQLFTAIDKNGLYKRILNSGIYTWQMKMLGFRAKEKDLIRGKMLQECKCISKCFNDEVDFFNSPRRARLLSFYPALVFLDLVDTKPAKYCLG